MGLSPSMVYQLDVKRRTDVLAVADGRRRATTAPIVRHHRMAHLMLSIARALKVESTRVPSDVAPTQPSRRLLRSRSPGWLIGPD